MGNNNILSYGYGNWTSCTCIMIEHLSMLTRISNLAFIAHFVLFVSKACAAPTSASGQRYAVKEFHHIPQQWNQVGPASADHLISLQIILKQSNFYELERHIYESEADAPARCCT